jgi:hypothetical protein
VVLALACFIGWRRGARWWHTVVSALVGVLVAYGPWLVASVAFGYAGVGINEGPKTGPGGRLEFIRELTAHGFRELRRNWIDQFWGNFAWINTPYPDWVQGVILVAVLGGIGLVAVAAWRAVRNRRASRRALLEPVGDPEDVLTVGVICLTSVAVTGAGLLWLMWQFFKKVGTFELVQGRNALMLVPAVIALPVMALRYLRPRLSPSIPLAVIAGSMIALNIIGLDLVIERFYL